MDAKTIIDQTEKYYLPVFVDISWHLPMVKAVSFMMLTVMNIWIF